MALIEIDALPSYIAWWIFPWQTHTNPKLAGIFRFQELGLQIVLDLHGCPGGESPEAAAAQHRHVGMGVFWQPECVGGYPPSYKLVYKPYS